MRADDPDENGPEPGADAPPRQAEAEGQQAGAPEGEPPGSPPAPTLEERLAAAEQEAKQKHDQLLRVAADFENYRKRARRDVDDVSRRAREDTLLAVLAVAYNLERALDHVDEADSGSIVEGVRLVHRQLLAVLEKFDVRPFDAVGLPFNPEEHDAVGQQETADGPPGSVLRVMQRGYRVGARVLRPAMVVVAKPPAAVDASVSPDTPDGAAEEA